VIDREQYTPGPASGAQARRARRLRSGDPRRWASPLCSETCSPSAGDSARSKIGVRLRRNPHPV
jgi:hypothetical protein